MVYGYARVNIYAQARADNSLEVQINALRNAVVIQIFSDVFSGSKNARHQFDKLLNIIQSSEDCTMKCVKGKKYRRLTT